MPSGLPAVLVIYLQIYPVVIVVKAFRPGGIAAVIILALGYTVKLI